MVEISDLERLLEPYGLIVRGVLAVRDEEPFPVVGTDASETQLVLVGNAGSHMWPSFNSSPERLDGRPHPMDRWCRRVGEEIARFLNGKAIFPFQGPPYPPFLAWAASAEAVYPSPVSLFIHPEFGLWHAYRFALIPGEPIGKVSRPGPGASPCLNCVDKPCLHACPVTAFRDNSYRVDDCTKFLVDNRQSACCTKGCAARRACPEGRKFIYKAEQARFHMDAFIKSRPVKDTE
jgi:hypothetical protein